LRTINAKVLMAMTQSTLAPSTNLMPLAAMLANKHERVIYYHDTFTGLKVIVAIHNTVLGPALGGTRIWAYSCEEDALSDVLRLSQSMTYKSAVAGLDLGGGKAVIIGDVRKAKQEAFLRRYGRFIESLHGNYITGPDVNVTIDDLVSIAKETKYIIGLPTLQGGSGDSSLATAYGTYMGIKAAVKNVYGSEKLQGKKIAIEGVGKVGSKLVSYLAKEGAKIYITDILSENLRAVSQQYEVQVIDTAHEFYDLNVDVYAPCALGATINDSTIARLKCQIIAGAANNQLEDATRHSRMLLEQGITYVPDFVINAGGVINVHTEVYGGYNEALAFAQIERIYEVCCKLLAQSKEENKTSHDVAICLAEERIEAMRNALLG
jgi:leucine dehydrogenase